MAAGRSTVPPTEVRSDHAVYEGPGAAWSRSRSFASAVRPMYRNVAFADDANRRSVYGAIADVVVRVAFALPLSY